MSSIEIGAHIITPRAGYTHHGIYIGDNLVIHYSGLAVELSAGSIEIISLESFQSGREVKVRKYKNPKYGGKIAVDRAKSRLGEDKYDLHGNNCEHFCTWVITGGSSSQQVELAEDFMDIVLPGQTINTLLKTRKHTIQGSDAWEVAKDVGGIGVKAAIVATAPVALPAIVIYKLFKWIYKSDSH
ncbi:MAG: lecithin retinol acyltransferase family protein [Geobacteraceae bacterium]|nr:lecithin retinol acyltransferase family protein [Geobacteraceae bacterium]